MILLLSGLCACLISNGKIFLVLVFFIMNSKLIKMKFNLNRINFIAIMFNIYFIIIQTAYIVSLCLNKEECFEL
jgi:hypothetical protein